MQNVNQQAQQPREAHEQDKQIPALGSQRIKEFLPGLHRISLEHSKCVDSRVVVVNFGVRLAFVAAAFRLAHCCLVEPSLSRPCKRPLHNERRSGFVAPGPSRESQRDSP
jgi:hypothetical protein